MLAANAKNVRVENINAKSPQLGLSPFNSTYNNCTFRLIQLIIKRGH
jgi:hypothetical protein